MVLVPLNDKNTPSSSETSMTRLSVQFQAADYDIIADRILTRQTDIPTFRE
jgi:hypothetical protein